jgi:FtsP/CotA-like multicopper oxidase with cupredoxin domain
LSRRRFLALGAGVTATAALGACGSTATPVGPRSPLVGEAARARRAAGARVVERTLTAAPATVDLGGVQVQTWAFDGQLPGPEIRLARDEVLRAELRNVLPQPTTIHWHGIALRNDMDGVPDLTQPAVAPQSQFTYEFAVPDAGTYFFHPHVGMQLDRGLYAPLVVTDPDEPGDYDLEAVIVLDDWLDGVDGRDPDQQLEQLRSEGMDMGGMDMGGMGMAGGAEAPLGPDAGDVDYSYYLINGRIGADPITVQAGPGQRLRLRIINAAADTAFRVALGGHRLTVTHSDGFPVEPAEGDALLIGMGERYDVEVTLADGVFPLVALAEGKQGQGFALVRTAGGTPPPPEAAPAELGGKLIMAPSLRATEAVRLPEREPDRTHELTLGTEMSGYRWTINGQVYGEHDPLPIESGERVRMRFVNRTMMFHPMHLHGHTYQQAVTGSGAGPRKDTSIVLPMQAVDIDIEGDNPGQWLLHCHNIYHGESGMMTVLSYAE